MSETQWELKLKSFLKKAGDDFKRAGNDMKQEAERLLVEAKDPERAKKIREGLADVSVWAKKTAEELAGYVENGVKKAEGVLKDAVAVAKPGATTAAPPPAPKSSAPKAATPAPKASAPKPPAGPAKKTVGRGTSKPSTTRRGGAKKPLGRAKR